MATQPADILGDRHASSLRQSAYPNALPAIRGGWRAAAGSPTRDSLPTVYFTDRGIEELADRRGSEQVTLEWLAEQLRTFVDLNPEFVLAFVGLAT